MLTEDLGQVGSWDDAAAKAKELLRTGRIQALATVSLEEYKRDKGAAAIMGDMLNEGFISMLPQFGAALYGGERFQLVTMDLPVDGLPDREFLSMLMIVYLHPGEIFELNSLSSTS